jgi:6-phosphogluconolactonase
MDDDGMNNKVIRISHSDRDTLLTTMAKDILLLAKTCIKLRGKFNLFLAGGNSPKVLYKELATKTDFPWVNTHLFWGDERHVPLDHIYSNFQMAQQTLLNHISIPNKQIHPIPTNTTLSADAKHYNHLLESHFKNGETVDLILLGIGPDGHTASLFPGDESLKETSQWAIPIKTSHIMPNVERISLSLSFINMANNLYFLVIGKEKKVILETICTALKEGTPSPYPAASVHSQDVIRFYSN